MRGRKHLGDFCCGLTGSRREMDFARPALRGERAAGTLMQATGQARWQVERSGAVQGPGGRTVLSPKARGSEESRNDAGSLFRVGDGRAGRRGLPTSLRARAERAYAEAAFLSHLEKKGWGESEREVGAGHETRVQHQAERDRYITFLARSRPTWGVTCCTECEGCAGGTYCSELISGCGHWAGGLRGAGPSWLGRAQNRYGEMQTSRARGAGWDARYFCIEKVSAKRRPAVPGGVGTPPAMKGETQK